MRTEPPISILDFRLPDAAEVPFEIGRLETTHRLSTSRRPHRHSYFQILWVTDGEGVHGADFEEHAIAPQSVFLISPGQVHVVRVDRPLSGYMALFTADFLDLDRIEGLPFFRPGEANPVLALSQDEIGHVGAIAEDLLAEFASRRPWRREMLRAQAQALLLTLGRIAHRQTVARLSGPLVASVAAAASVGRFQALIEERFRHLHRVAEYAALLGLTPGHLSELSKEATGRTAGELIDARLVLEAKRLLAHADETTAEIAADLGFRDPSYFGRFFRRQVGRSPGAFRTAIREKYQDDR